MVYPKSRPNKDPKSEPKTPRASHKGDCIAVLRIYLLAMKDAVAANPSQTPRWIKVPIMFVSGIKLVGLLMLLRGELY